MLLTLIPKVKTAMNTSSPAEPVAKLFLVDGLIAIINMGPIRNNSPVAAVRKRHSPFDERKHFSRSFSFRERPLSRCALVVRTRHPHRLGLHECFAQRIDFHIRLVKVGIVGIEFCRFRCSEN
jgi:hypothetical protein